MKIIVGIDHSQAAERAASLAARLGFRDPMLRLVHVVADLEAYGFASELPPAPELIDRLMREQIDSGRRRLAECTEIATAAARGGDVSSVIRRGHVANELLETARDEGSELIAVGSGKTSAEALLLGSVSRKLLSASPQSLLIAKDRPLGPGPLRAVFATDHSPYAQKCAELLARMAPRGLGHLTVVSAYPKQLVDVMRSVVEHFRADVDSWVEKSLDEENKRVARDLKDLHCEITTRVLGRAPDAAIQQAAIEADADLIILGAQGHGAWHRLLTGSVSYRVAVETDRHVLILRAP
jgi:nucleotide-binding universal stress UspA family protein